jgi:hypothetical protein
MRSHLLFSFVDRDMIMRYHWGHGVGHLYSRDTQLADIRNHDGADKQTTVTDEVESDLEQDLQQELVAEAEIDPLVDHENEDLGDEDSDASEGSESQLDIDSNDIDDLYL